MAYHLLPVLRVRKPNADRLINKEHICKLISRLRVIFVLDPHIVSVVLDNPARAQLHEQAHDGGAPQAAVGPEYHVVFGRVVPAFEKSRKSGEYQRRCTPAVAKGGFLDADAVMREEWMPETSVVCGEGEGGEVFEWSEKAELCAWDPRPGPYIPILYRDLIMMNCHQNNDSYLLL